MRFGIIGYGRMGKLYYNVLTNMMGIEVSFICDLIKPDNNTQHFTDFRQALDETFVDGIIISTYGPSHYEITKYAIEKKIKYIVCEKPFTTSALYADELGDRLKNSQTRLTVNYSRRFSKMYSELKSELQQGIIGKTRSMVISCGAGGLSTIGTHLFDLCSYLQDDEIISVYAVEVNKNLSNPRGKEFEDPGGFVLLTFKSEKRVFLDLGDDLGLQPLFEIIGEYGRVMIDEINENIIIRSRSVEDRKKPNHLYGLPNPIVRNDTFRLEPMNELIFNMISNLISNSPLVVNVDKAKVNVHIYSAIRKSFDTKQPVFMPIIDEYYEKEFMVT